MTRSLLSLTLVALLAAPVAAAPHKGPGGPHRPDGMAEMFQTLGLSADQKAKVQAIRQRHLEAVKADVTALKARQQELAALLRAADATVEQSVAKQHEISAIKSRLSEGRVRAWFETRALLTPAQLKRLPAWKAEHRPHREDW
jgi:Spy/CpxP family protein refolding chaperone